MDNNLTGPIILDLVIGFVLIVWGIMILKFKINPNTDYMNGNYEPQKVSEIIGKHVIALGILTSCYTIVNFYLTETNIYQNIYIALMMIIVVNSCYQIHTRARTK